jgi:uncharacterized protein YjbI with pentapeptide repeats
LVAAVLALTPALIVRNRSGSSRDGVDTLWMGTKDIESSKKGIHQIAGIGTSICFLLFSSEVSHAIGEDISYKLPPVDKSDPKRCVLQSSSMGQANAARNKLYDLRECKLDPKSQSGAGKDMSGAVFSEADFTGIDFKEAQLSKVYARNSKFVNCDFTDGVVDRVSFDGSDMTGAIFKNAVLSGTTFAGANLKDTDFTDSYIGPFDLKKLCANPTLQGTNPVTKEDTKVSATCGI